MNTYIIVDPKNQRVSSSDTWVGAIELSAMLSLKRGVMYSVVSLRGTPLPYPRERRQVVNALAHYIELHIAHPGTLITYNAKRQFEQKLAHTGNLMKTYMELEGTDTLERCAASTSYLSRPTL